MVIVEESKAVPIPNKDKAIFRVLFIIKGIAQFICIFLPCPPDTFLKEPMVTLHLLLFFYECGISVHLQMCLYTMCMQYLQRAEGGIRSPETGVSGVSHHVGVWN